MLYECLVDVKVKKRVVDAYEISKSVDAVKRIDANGRRRVHANESASM